MKPGRLGVYDSGLGGLTVLAALRDAGIDQEIVYFADQAHVPYGDKADADILGFLTENVRLLEGLGVDAIVTACNTSCAVAQRLGWPPATVPVLDLIAAAGAAFAGSAQRRIGVVATSATVRAGAYGRAIHAALPSAAVFERPAPALVPLVERGAAQTQEAQDAVRAVVATLPGDLDALVYGCTHYPLLDAWFAAALPAATARVDPALAQAAAAVRLVASAGISPGDGTTRFYTNGDPVAFEREVRRWSGDARASVGALIAR